MPHKFNGNYLAFFVVGLLLILAAACNGGKAQDFEVELFDGERFRLSEQHADNVVVINFWYPSCPPCREEMPEFQRAWEELQGEPVRLLGLFVPKSFDNEQAAREFVAGAWSDFRLRRRPHGESLRRRMESNTTRQPGS